MNHNDGEDSRGRESKNKSKSKSESESKSKSKSESSGSGRKAVRMIAVAYANVWYYDTCAKRMRKKKQTKRRAGASYGQRYLLPCCTHLGNLKCKRYC